jgi:glucosamine--fructose-6-phosphate aminotransferase (isomerizing)
MCGIIGYVGSEPVVPLLFAGLKRLEYRGYDSSGIAILEREKMTLFRRVGKVEQLEEEVLPHQLTARIGIGHTRWATHGVPTEENAHPHLDCRGKIAVIHNGIIENFLDLKERLTARGHRFRSQTDTEVLAHLIEEHDDGDLLAAVAAAAREAKGAFALAVLSEDDPERIIVARRGSPLVLGKGKSGTFACSDVPAIAGEASQLFFLADDELAELTAQGFHAFNLEGEEVERPPQEMTMNPLAIQKGGYKHFMLKEIHEQPRAVGETLYEKLEAGRSTINLSGLKKIDMNFDRVYLIACGTAYHAGLTAEYLWERVLPVPIQAVIASEFRLREMHITPRTLVVAVSQSGETLDTLMAVRHAKEKGATVIALINSSNSAIERESDGVVYTRAGIEIGVAATKTFSAQVAALALLGLFLAKRCGAISDETLKEELAGLTLLPGQITQLLAREEAIASLAERFYNATDFLFLARGPLYPIALEGALKLKEISYIHAEGYPAGEMKHGPIALIDEQMPVVVLLSHQIAYDKVLGNMQEVKARKGIVIALTDRPDDPILPKLADHTIALPAATPICLPILYTIPMQLLAYHIAILRGTDVDQPRNLAKTVTVE